MRNKLTLKVLLLIVFVISYTLTVESKNVTIKDSLLNVLSKNNPDTVKVNVLSALGWEYKFSNPDSSILFLKQALTLAKKSNFKKGEASVLCNTGIYYHIQGNYPFALQNYLNSMKLLEALSKESANQKRQSEIKNGISSIVSNMGLIYKNLAENENSKKGRDSLYNKALEYYYKSLKIDKELGKKSGIAKVYSNIGVVYKDKSAKEKIKISQDSLLTRAFEFYMKALDIQNELNDKVGISRTLDKIGIIYSEQKKFTQAEGYFSRAMTLVEETGDKHHKAILLGNIGRMYISMGKFKEAEELLKESLEIDIEFGEIDGQKYKYEALYLLYDTIGKHELALESYIKYIEARDSIFNDENEEKLMRTEMSYEFEKKEAIAKAEQEKKDAIVQQEMKRQKMQRNYSIAGVGFFLLLSLLIFRSFIQKKKANQVISEQKRIVEEQKAVVEHQKELVEEKNQEILDSITYAKRLQDAILPPLKLVKQNLENSFILYKPKDIVAGDFYWMELASVAEALEAPMQDGVSISGTSTGSVTDTILFAAADCTGHGVPGAMVSVVCSNALNRTVKEFGITEPGKILDKVTDLVIETFEKSEAEVKDGMDISLCSIRYQVSGIKTNAILQWAGANNPLWVVRASGTSMLRQAQQPNTSVTDSSHISHLNTQFSLQEIKADKQPIGKYSDRNPFTTHTIELNEGDSIYIFTDGYADQFGGEKGKKFKSSKMKELILSIQNEPMDKQKQMISEAFEEWKGSLEQVDDVCIIGVKI